jgi:hypothetical protein
MWEQKLQKSWNKNFKILRTKVTKISKYGNKNLKNLGKKFKKTGNIIQERKFKNPRTKNTKNWEQKVQKSEN